MRLRVIVVSCLAVSGLASAALVMIPRLDSTASGAWRRPSPPTTVTPGTSPTAGPTGAAPPTLAVPDDAASVQVDGPYRFGWAMVDRRTGETSGSVNAGVVTNTVESMIKPWIVGDYLRRLDEQQMRPTQQELDELSLAIVDSNDTVAQKYYIKGGADAVVRRLVSICGLTDTTIRPGWWSYTQMTPNDAIRYATCLADGRATGERWTPWLLQTMREVRGRVTDQRSVGVQGGRWGILDALPARLASQTAIKNGWTLHDDGWHVNCLAVHDDWAVAVMLRTNESLTNAAQNCRAVAEALLVNPA